MPLVVLRHLTTFPHTMWPAIGACVLMLLSSTAQAQDATALDTGDTAWVMTSTALVLFMTLPGLALFYAGMVRKKNVLATMMHSLGAAALVSVLWVVAGYSLAFTDGGSMHAFVGGLDNAMLGNLELDTLSGTIPESLFIVFQMTFAIITVAIISGAFAERIKFLAYMLFSGLWVLLVYAPVCHWVWGGGWMAEDGAMDFAGGTVVHVNAGVAGLVAAFVLGKRVGYGRETMAPHNLALTFIGTGMLCVGWFGFNAGSALGANAGAAMAMVVTQVAAAAGALAWLLVEHVLRGKASLLGGASGAVAGLVGITPAAGFVDVSGALAIGGLTAVACYWGTGGLKKLLKADDSLDAFGLHGVGGIVGALLTAVFASSAITGAEDYDMLVQLWVQAEGVIATIFYSGVMSFLLLKLVDKTLGLRVEIDEEREGLDISQHGERVE